MAVHASDPITIAGGSGEPGSSLSAPSLTALPGDGFAAPWGRLRFFDGDGRETAASDGMLGSASGHITASTNGTVAVIGGGGSASVAVQVFDLDGNPVAAEQPIFAPGPEAFAVPLGLAPTATGGYAAVWRWREDDGPFASQLRLVGPDGVAVPNATDIGEDARSAARAAIAADGEIKLLATIEDGGTRAMLFRFSVDGNPLGDPQPLETTDGLPLFDATLSNLGHAFAQLANGDLVATGVEPYPHPVPRPVPPAIFVQRLDGNGNPIAPRVDTNVLITADEQIAPLQDGGYVLAWTAGPTAAVEFQIYDRDDVAVTERQTVEGAAGSFDIATLDDGRFVIAYGPTLPGGEASARIFDHAPSHTATPGGTVAVIQSWQDQLAIGRDDGIDTLVTSDSLPLLPFIPNVTLAGTADLNADGNDMANFMIGNDGANILVGYLGNDVMHGHDGDDFLAMGRGNDVADTGDGQNTVWGGQGDDSIQGGSGDDVLNGDRHDDVIDGGAGDDSINGGSHDDLLTGNDGGDSITGGTGADTLEGWDGADTLRGDRDDDRLVGGNGADRFVFAALSGEDTVLDFDWMAGHAESDRIVVEVENGMINGVAIASAADLWARSADSLHGLRVDLGDGHAIILQGQIRSSLSQDIFELVVV